MAQRDTYVVRMLNGLLDTCINVKQADPEMSLMLRGKGKKPFWIRIRQNQIKGGSNPPCGFSLPISGLSFISGPWWGCHVDRPMSYYDNGSRGSTCSGGYCLLGDVRKTGGMCTKTKIEGVIDTRKASVKGEVKLECAGLEVCLCVCNLVHH